MEDGTLGNGSLNEAIFDGCVTSMWNATHVFFPQVREPCLHLH